MAISEQELEGAIRLIGRIDSTEQLRRLAEHLNRTREVLNRINIREFRVGERVSYVNQKMGGILIHGTIKKIKQKYIEVATEGREHEVWNVQAANLTKAPKEVSP